MMDISPQAATPLITPAALKQEIPLSPTLQQHIYSQRKAITHILNGTDDRLLVVLGPCSIHDPTSAVEYASRLATIQNALSNELLLVMRVYLEKPRTTTGWKGLINDPDINNTCDINRGYAVARKLLSAICQLGVAAGTEFLSLITPHYIADLISWSAIGARTVNSPLHRELASGLAMPVGFKNDINGNVQTAIDALHAAQYAQQATSFSATGDVIIAKTAGNPNGHIILRGGIHSPNYDEYSLSHNHHLLNTKQALGNRIMIDCSHDNSRKNHLQQLQIVTTICQYLTSNKPGLMGVMLESHLLAGKQAIHPNTALTYGQSITDACISWEMTYQALQALQQAVQQRRDVKQNQHLHFQAEINQK